MLDGKGGERRIGDQCSAYLRIQSLLPQNVPEVSRCVDHHDIRPLEPCRNDVAGLEMRERMFDSTRAGGDTYECKDSLPSQGNGFGGGESGLEPRAAGLVLS